MVSSLGQSQTKISDDANSQDTDIVGQLSYSTAENQCTSCKRAIVSCFDACLHPLLSVLVCKRCHDSYGDGDFSVLEDYADDFGDENYCRWCMDGGELLVCANMDHYAGKKCHYAFCQDCISRNLPNYQHKHNIAFPFICFACDPSPLEALRKESLRMVRRLSREQPSQMEIESDETEEAINCIASEQDDNTDNISGQTEMSPVIQDANSSNEQLTKPTEQHTDTTDDTHDTTNHDNSLDTPQMEITMHNKLDADAYLRHLKKDDLAYLSYNPRVYTAEELTTQLNSIKEDKILISDHHTNFFDKLMEECQACIDGRLDPCNGRVLLTLMRNQSFIEVKNLLIMYRKIDSLIESLPID